MEKRIILTEMGTAYAETINRVPLDFKQLTSSLAPKPDLVGGTPASVVVCPMLEPDSFLTVSLPGMELWAVKRFRELPFTSTMAVVGDPPHLIPGFATNGGVTVFTTTLTYVPPEDQALLLLLSLRDGGSLLVAMDPVSGMTYYPALPNTYRDGQLCTGSAPIPAASDIFRLGLARYQQMWLDAWHSAPFNGDLVSSGEGSVESACQFDPVTMRNLPLPVDWRVVFPRLALNNSAATRVLAALLEGGVL